MAAMLKPIKVVVEKHADGYLAYQPGLKGIVVGEGGTYEDALADVNSAIQFHLATFGVDALGGDLPFTMTH
jgi:predicted RNase H-like HicB family nuclease